VTAPRRFAGVVGSVLVVSLFVFATVAAGTPLVTHERTGATSETTPTDQTAATAAPAPAGPTDATAEKTLLVTDAETGRALLAVSVSNGTFVGLEYTHSVEKTEVLDGYRVNGTRLEMTKMVFNSFGAGLPSRVEVNRTGDGSFVFDPNGTYESLYVAPGDVAGHELVVGDRRYDLVALSDERTVELRVVAGDFHVLSAATGDSLALSTLP